MPERDSLMRILARAPKIRDPPRGANRPAQLSRFEGLNSISDTHPRWRVEIVRGERRVGGISNKRWSKTSMMIVARRAEKRSLFISLLRFSRTTPPDSKLFLHS